MNSLKQGSLRFVQKSSYLEDDYVVSESNHDVYTTIKNYNNSWGINPYYKTLLIVGPASSGKTHLAHIWSHECGGAFVRSMKEVHDLQSQGYIVEDIESVDAAGLFHIINYLHEESKYLLMTASSVNFNFHLKDLVSRLLIIRTIHITTPDENMIKMLLMKYFSLHSLKISIQVIDFLSTRLPRDCGVIKNFVDEVNQYALEHKREITIPLAKELLAQHTNTVSI